MHIGPILLMELTTRLVSIISATTWPFSDDDRTQRERCFAIVDEVDSILIDEARTPLIISGGVENSAQVYRIIDSIIPENEATD